MEKSAEIAWEMLVARDREMQARARELAQEGRPRRLSDVHNPRLTYLVSPDLDEPGCWRTTTFLDGQPIGHTVEFSAEAAFLHHLRRNHLL